MPVPCIQLIHWLLSKKNLLTSRPTSRKRSRREFFIDMTFPDIVKSTSKTNSSTRYVQPVLTGNSEQTLLKNSLNVQWQITKNAVHLVTERARRERLRREIYTSTFNLLKKKNEGKKSKRESSLLEIKGDLVKQQRGKILRRRLLSCNQTAIELRGAWWGEDVAAARPL